MTPCTYVLLYPVNRRERLMPVSFRSFFDNNHTQQTAV